MGLDAIVPQRQDLCCASGQLRCAKCGQLCGCGCCAVLPVCARLSATNGNAWSVAAFYIAEEFIRTTRHDARKHVAAAEFLYIRDHRLLHKGVVLPVSPVEQGRVVRPILREKCGLIEEPVRQTMAHFIGADVEPEARAVAVVMRAP